MILDTNAVSAWAEGVASMESRLQSAARLVVPCIVLGEYYYGIRQSRFRRRYEEWLRGNLPHVEIATVAYNTASRYADIRLELKDSGTPIPSNEIWIAAIARQHRLPILSNDAHFDAVNGIDRISF